MAKHKHDHKDHNTEKDSESALSTRVEYKGHGHDCESLGIKRYTVTGDPKGKFEPTGQCRRYVSLHHHSTYSNLDGFALPEAHVRRAGELGMGALALTEHGNISSHVGLEKAALKEGVKPIFGCEIYMGETGEGRTQRKNHLTVLASTQEGYKNLLRLVSRGWQQFYYEPTVSKKDLKEFSDGLIVLSGCTGSLLATSLVGGKNVAPEDASYARARKEAKWFKKVFGDRYYLEAQAFPELDNVKKINKGLVRLGEDLGIQLVATGDVHYTRPSEAELQKILHNVRGGGRQTLEEQARAWGYDVPLCPPVSDVEILKRVIGTGLTRKQAISAVLATEEIASRCDVTLPKMAPLRYPIPAEFRDRGEIWRRWLQDGWDYRGIKWKPNVRAYKERLQHEMEIIEAKDFVDYFLFVSDMVRFAKDSGIPVGPARGSAAASLVCYLLRITEVDPLMFPDMLFERFIDLTRSDLPDIDLDFDDERRQEISDYLAAKYGSDRVGNIGTFTQYKSKLALDDVARVYRIPKFKVDTVKALLVERSSGDLRASSTIEDTVLMFEAAAEVFKENPDLGAAMDLEGNVKGMGMHAAGVVVASGPLTDVCATYERVVAGRVAQALSVNKKDAEYLNLLKMDVLGLSTMGMIAHVLRMIGKPLEWLYEIPLDDAETLRGFQENDVVGVFQFDGRAMRNVNGELKPDDFAEVCLVTALARPGPLHNGASAEYIDIKHGRREGRSYHPLMEKIVRTTHGQIVYQEQILRITGEIGGFDHTHRSTIRRIISQKIGEQEFNRWWERFRDGAAKRGVSEEEASKIWRSCITAGSYAFNIAHSVSYGMIAWWTMYLKRHHPVEFFTASLRKYNPKKQLDLLKDMEAFGRKLKVLKPHVKRSGITWEPGKNGVRAGFSQISGIGDVTAEAIVKYRDEFGLSGWGDLIKIKGIGAKTIEKIESFVKEDDPFGIHRIERRVDEVRSLMRKRKIVNVPWPTHKAIDIPYSRTPTKVSVVWCGEIVARNLKELFELHFSRTGEHLDRNTVKDPDLNEWVVLTGDDGTDLLTITVTRWDYEKFRELIWSIRPKVDIVVVKGFKRPNESRRAIYVTGMWVLSTEEEDEEEGQEQEG